MRLNNTQLEMVRGDSESITIKVEYDNGEDYILEHGDVVYFTIKQHPNTERKLLQKKIEAFDGNEAVIEIKPEDTKGFRFDKYVYDIQLTTKDGKVTTIVPCSNFIISEEVTYE